MNQYSHSRITFHGRQGNLVVADGGRWYGFYDSATALLSEVDSRLGSWLLSQEEPTEEVSQLSVEALSALTAFEDKTREGHFASAVAVEPMHTIALGVEAACNLACTYCYNYSHYDRPAFRPKTTGMSLETALEAIRKVLVTLQAGDKLTVQLIGGEPLLQYPLIKRLIPEAESMAESYRCEIRFGMNTNGLALTGEVAAFLLEHRVGIAISLDGSPRQHDKHRRTNGGNGSYGMLEPRIKDFMAVARHQCPVRTGRITASEKDFNFVEAVEHLRTLGFNNIGLGLALGAMLTEAKTEEGKANVIECLLVEFRRLKDYCMTNYKAGNLFRISLFNDTMYSLYAYRPKYVPCGAQRRYVGVSPNGDIVPCHRYIGTKNKDRILGSVLDDSANLLSPLDRGQRLDKLGFVTVTDDIRADDYACSTCWARHLCGGECYEVRESLGDSFATDKPYMCDLKRELYKMGIEMLCELQQFPDLLRSLMEMNALLKPEAPKAESEVV